jgi:hypothetical protein
MSKPLDELYFTWLCSQVADLEEKDSSLTYWKLLRQLYQKPFFAVEGMIKDENRAEEGRELRLEFIRKRRIRNPEQDWVEMDCSMFELMVGLARGLEFEAGGKPHFWFWKLVENLGLIRCTDRSRYPKNHVDHILDDVIYRRYAKSGLGGFFPLRYPDKDQRDVELWYQLCAYVLERE